MDDLQSGEPVSWDRGQATPDIGLDRHGPDSPSRTSQIRDRADAAESSRGCRLLVCEGTYGSDEDLPKAVRNQHMTFREAATLARNAAAGRLWITHFSPGSKTRMNFAEMPGDVFPRTVIGRDGLTIGLPFPEE